jgi:CYTH domain-containing protein
MVQEIERKFLLDGRPSIIEGRPSTRVTQGYLAITDDTEVRVRSRADDRLLTVKRGRGAVRGEVTIPLTDEQFDEMWAFTAGRRLTKRRWVVPHDAVIVEIDVYDGDLDGLVIAEVEFPSVEASVAFTPPDWFGREVTDDPAYRNAALATTSAEGATSVRDR